MLLLDKIPVVTPTHSKSPGHTLDAPGSRARGWVHYRMNVSFHTGLRVWFITWVRWIWSSGMRSLTTAFILFLCSGWAGSWLLASMPSRQYGSLSPARVEVWEFPWEQQLLLFPQTPTHLHLPLTSLPKIPLASFTVAFRQ